MSSPIPDPAAAPPERPRTPWLEQPVWFRRLAYAALSLLLVACGFAVAGLIVVRHPLPDTDGSVKLAGLIGEVRVLRDEQGVPQLYADNTDDLFFAQGFVQAQDRFWQMDVGRHLSAGRLSELFGPSTLKSDELVRTMGWRRVAEQEYDLLAPETRDYLAAFADGVNAYLKGRSVFAMSLEYSVLGLSGLDYEPADWTPVDSLAWLKALAWDLRSNMDVEIDRANLAPRLSQTQIEELYPAYPYDTNRPIMDWPPQTTPPPSAQAGGVPRPPVTIGTDRPRAMQRDLDRIPSMFGHGEGIGSNSFVVSGRFTDTGAPYLENDPHLTATQPGVWYQMGLHCNRVSPECPFEVSGFTMAGFPGVMVGQNQHIAWGLTNMQADVTDLYLEKIEGQSALYDGELMPLDKHDEVIRIRGRDSKVFTVRSTRHGPLLSDVSAELSSVGANADIPERPTPRPTVASIVGAERPTEAPVEVPERGNGYGVALAWSALTPKPSADAIFLLNQAADFADFREAAKRLAAPAFNLLYADDAGNIGYQAPGDIPLRNWGHTGAVPIPGWDSRYDWAGFVDFDRLPSVLNPTDGFIVAANQAPVAASYPH
ncbi:MAG TPA: penicillin acylase family protein, partial [Marmoricola sp.]|nr:penicillin acylase family protein [Marmoricola sp.]